MKIKATTNFREFIFDTEEMKLQNRGGLGVSIFGLAKKQLRKGENLLRVDFAEYRGNNGYF